MSFVVPIYRTSRRSEARRRQKRAQQSSQKRAKLASSRERFHLKRTEISIRSELPQGGDHTKCSGALFLSELSLGEVSLFSAKFFKPGVQVILTIPFPRAFYLRGRVIGCRDRIHHSGIISARPLSYRLTVRFDFNSKLEEAAFKRYLEHIVRFNLDSTGPL